MELRRSIDLFADVAEHLLNDDHHVFQVCIGFIELKQSELRVMVPTETFTISKHLRKGENLLHVVLLVTRN